jgi:hypothetical protein
MSGNYHFNPHGHPAPLRVKVLLLCHLVLWQTLVCRAISGNNCDPIRTLMREVASGYAEDRQGDLSAFDADSDFSACVLQVLL